MKKQLPARNNRSKVPQPRRPSLQPGCKNFPVPLHPETNHDIKWHTHIIIKNFANTGARPTMDITDIIIITITMTTITTRTDTNTTMNTMAA